MSDLYLASANWLVYKFSSISDEILLSGPICPNLCFR